MKKIKALLIDWDGTLVDNLSLLFEVYCRFLKNFNQNPTIEEFNELNGPSLIEILALLKEKYNLPGSVSELQSKYVSDLEELYVKSLNLFPYAKETLLYAKGMGFKIVLVTSAKRQWVEKIIENLQLAPLFDGVITPEESMPGKPHPAVYLKALLSLKLPPSKAIAIEDSFNGVKSATAAGLFTLWLTRQHHPIYKHSLQIPDWNGILRYLKENYELSDV